MFEYLFFYLRLKFILIRLIMLTNNLKDFQQKRQNNFQTHILSECSHEIHL